MMRSTHDHEDRVRYRRRSTNTWRGLSWSWVDRNQKSIIALLNYREFSFTKIEISIATAFYRVAKLSLARS